MVMEFYITKLLLIVVLTCFIKFVTASHDHDNIITVSPSCDLLSSQCVTLSEFVFPQSSSLSTKLSLTLLPGHHVFHTHVLDNGASFSVTGTPGATFVTCSDQHSQHLNLQNIHKIAIKGVSFQGCNFRISGSNNTIISQSVFAYGTNGALKFLDCHNVSIDRSFFDKNSIMRSPRNNGVITISQSRNVTITRTNFTESASSSRYGAVLYITSDSYVSISCCKFDNNSIADYYGAIVRASSSSTLYITNSSFTENRGSYYGGIIFSISGAVIVVSSVFTSNTASGGVVRIDDGACAILASEFYNNQGSSIYIRYRGRVTVDCTRFLNNSARIDVEGNPFFSVYHSTSCSERFAVGDRGICQENFSDCEGKSIMINS